MPLLTFNSWSIESVNAVLGDISYEEKFGVLPNDKSNEIVRIQTHLEYVQNYLRANTPEGFTESALKNRLAIIDILSVYRKNEQFPSLTVAIDVTREKLLEAKLDTLQNDFESISAVNQDQELIIDSLDKTLKSK